MKMKNAALRALYGALTLSLIILGGCDQATDPDNNKDTEEDQWETLLKANDSETQWVKNINNDPQHARIKFTSDRKIYVILADEDEWRRIYTQCTFDGRVIKSDNENEQNHKIIITDRVDLGYGYQFTLGASGSLYIMNLDRDFSGTFRSSK
jgi:hypothetical protein